MNLKVLKFGGTSLATVDAITQCRQIVLDNTVDHHVVVVVSALGGITDQLIAVAKAARSKNEQVVTAEFDAIQQRHRETVAAFVAPQNFDDVWQQEFAPLFEQLHSILYGTLFVGDMTDRIFASICSFGEQLSSRIVCHAFRQSDMSSQAVNATTIVRTNADYLNATVDLPITKELTYATLSPLIHRDVVPVVTGFIGQEPQGYLTLLGRGGTDYTASLIAVSLDADALEIWKDVDGIMSADPRLVKNVRVWEAIEMPVMAEMSYNGAKVLHPKTIGGAVERNIPVYIKNTFNPTAPGTRVLMAGEEAEECNVRGIVVAKNQILYHLADPTIIQAIGFVEKVTHVFARHRIPIDVLATSEISFSCSVDASDEHHEVQEELKDIVPVTIVRGLAKVSITGKNIGCNARIIAQIFRTIADYPIHTTSIDAAHHNVTLLVNEQDADDILHLLHSSLFETCPLSLSWVPQEPLAVSA